MFCPLTRCSCPRIPCSCFVPWGKRVARVSVSSDPFSKRISSCFVLLLFDHALGFLRTFDRVYDSIFTYVLLASASVQFRPWYVLRIVSAFKNLFDCFGSCFIPRTSDHVLNSCSLLMPAEPLLMFRPLWGVASVLSFCSLLIPSDSLLMFCPLREGGEAVAHVSLFGSFTIYIISFFLMFCLPVLRSNLVLEIFAQF